MPQSKTLRVNFIEPGCRKQAGWNQSILEEDILISTKDLEAYCFSSWQPIVYDAMLVAAAVEYCDRVKVRPLTWSRRFEIKIAVHEPDRWNKKETHNALLDCLRFLTGDHWKIKFVSRKRKLQPPKQMPLNLPNGLKTIIPYSDGVDSLAVAGLVSEKFGKHLFRVRLGPKTVRGQRVIEPNLPFAVVPYKVKAGGNRFDESSARSRGFKFMMLSGLAAYLVDASSILVPESGQGVFGPSLVEVGQTYGDYRNHPFFTNRMKSFFKLLLDFDLNFQFPRLWYTKGETLSEYWNTHKSDEFPYTSSCWQGNRHVPVSGKKRQCGICAACMLRRLSFHAAGIEEPKDTYVWENLNASTFEGAADEYFDSQKITAWQKEYAIAGVLHLEHLAKLLETEAGNSKIELLAFQLSRYLEEEQGEIRLKLLRLLQKHSSEWSEFLHSLSSNSFVLNWVER